MNCVSVVKNRLSIVVVLALAVCGVCSNLDAQVIPTSIAHLYEGDVDVTVSDDFDAPTLDTGKWAYRTWPSAANWDPEGIELIDDGTDKYVSLGGQWNRTTDVNGNIYGSGTSSGLSGRNAGGFGFYTTRWRTEGISPTQRSSWHPAIWMNRSNLGNPSAGAFPNEQVEIDFVEYYQSPSLQYPRWHSQVIPRTRVNGNVVQTKIKHNAFDTDFVPDPGTFWNTHGLEYHPDYIQLWEYDELTADWAKRGFKVTITDNPNATTTHPSDPGYNTNGVNNINRDHANPGYWILSNYDFFERTEEIWGRSITAADNFLMGDSSFQIDHFRYYPLYEGLEGDFNGDGHVDAADYTVWRDGLNGADPAGYDSWKANYGGTAVGNSATGVAAPEPASGALLILATGGMMLPRRRR